MLRAIIHLWIKGSAAIDFTRTPSYSDKVNPRSDRITVDGVVLSLRPSADVKWVVLYKPKGAVTTTNDEKGALLA
jgi:16S rRNA U516 pseudouridylate synthase RsuA-like enzyme